MDEIKKFRKRILDIIRQHINELDCGEEYETVLTVLELGTLFEKVGAVNIEQSDVTAKELEKFREKVLGIIRCQISEIDCVEDYETEFELGILFEKVRAINVECCET